MKEIYLIAILIFLLSHTKAQECRVLLKSDDGKKIVFLIKIEGTNLEFKSDSTGVLVVADSLKNMFTNNDISFRYHHNLDNEYYRTPQFIRKNRALYEVCGQILMAERRD